MFDVGVTVRSSKLKFALINTMGPGIFVRFSD